MTSTRTLEVVCPGCHGSLLLTAEQMNCVRCGAHYPLMHGFADLIVGDYYDDDTAECAVLNEETTNRDTSDRYWIPLFQKLWPEGHASRRILSLGCGVGADVERLVECGFDAYGLDNGKRTAVWAARRRFPERLFRANGKHMPFEDATFDAIFCGCVFPHVGVVGTTFDTTDDCEAQRTELAAEMARVLRPGGRIIVCNPNRFFPFDIFHGHQAGKVVLRPTMPWQRLLLSRGDYFRMFRAFGCIRATALPVDGYWSFTNSRKSWKGRMLAAPIAALFRFVSKSEVLSASPLNPWLIVMLEKDRLAR
jgi:SAM-dependent methyltransferase